MLQVWSLALVLQSLAFALERREQLLELSFHHKIGFVIVAHGLQ